MRSEVALKTSELLRGYGSVKWFGGVNSKTGRENHFGFIEDLSGKDVFVHRREWRGKWTCPVSTDTSKLLGFDGLVCLNLGQL